jgi:hypothetical protein
VDWRSSTELTSLQFLLKNTGGPTVWFNLLNFELGTWLRPHWSLDENGCYISPVRIKQIMLYPYSRRGPRAFLYNNFRGGFVHKIMVFMIQCWPKVTHAKKRTSHAGCNAWDARFRRVLHRICYSNFAHMKRASCAQHLRGRCAGCCSGSMWLTRVTRVGCTLLTRLSRVCRPFMYCRCRALLARRKCAGPWFTFGQYGTCEKLFDRETWSLTYMS